MSTYHLEQKKEISLILFARALSGHAVIDEHKKTGPICLFYFVVIMAWYESAQIKRIKEISFLFLVTSKILIMQFLAGLLILAWIRLIVSDPGSIIVLCQ